MNLLKSASKMRQKLSATNQNDDNDTTIDTIDNLVSQNEATLENLLLMKTISLLVLLEHNHKKQAHLKRTKLKAKHLNFLNLQIYGKEIMHQKN